MATPLENMQTAYERVTAKIAELTLSLKPDYSIDGRSYQHSSQLTALLKQQKDLLAAIQDAQGPFEVISYGN